MDYLTADIHGGHSNILKHCRRLRFMSDAERAVMEGGETNAISKLRISWESTDRMDRELFGNINSMVGENDTLYILGDFCWARGATDKIVNIYAKYRNQIKCRRVYLIWGNHDPKQGTSGRDAVRRLFSGTYNLHSAHVQDDLVVMCHYAMLRWDRCHYGSFLAFGHSHGTLSEWIDANISDYRGLDVGVDSAYKLLGEYRPFAFEEFRKIILSKKILQ